MQLGALELDTVVELLAALPDPLLDKFVRILSRRAGDVKRGLKRLRVAIDQYQAGSAAGLHELFAEGIGLLMFVQMLPGCLESSALGFSPILGLRRELRSATGWVVIGSHGRVGSPDRALCSILATHIPPLALPLARRPLSHPQGAHVSMNISRHPFSIPAVEWRCAPPPLMTADGSGQWSAQVPVCIAQHVLAGCRRSADARDACRCFRCDCRAA